MNAPPVKLNGATAAPANIKDVLAQQSSAITPPTSTTPKPQVPVENHLAPPSAPTTSIGRALSGTMGSIGLQNGYAQCMSDTPLPSAPTTAPASPRL